VTNESVAIPAVSISGEHLREWTVKEFSRVKRRLRSNVPVTWRVTYADGRVEYEQLPLPPPQRWPGGRPRRSTITDKGLLAELIKLPRPTSKALADQFGVTVRHIRRRIKQLLSR
jgi:hypothetical protein